MTNRKPLKVEKLYKPYKPYFCVNYNDTNLTPIYISLPSPPKDVTKIAGFGRHLDEQYFRREEIPEKLVNLEKHVLSSLEEEYNKDRTRSVTGYKIILKFWEELEENREYYEDEIDFIKRVWWHIVHGYFFYNDGEIKYISGWHYYYLNFWRMKDSPYVLEYRERDRLKFLFYKYINETTETFAHLDRNGNAVKNEDGKYEMIDMGVRVFYGVIEPKTRRSGASMQGCCTTYLNTTSGFGRKAVIVSKDGENAEKIYNDIMVPGWAASPIWLKPIWHGNNKPSSLLFIAPPARHSVVALNSTIEFTESANETKNDGSKIHSGIYDEQGKALRVNVLERWNVNKLAMSTGGGTKIIGWCTHPSTVEEMDAGGEAYQKMCNMSDFYNRIPNKGQTKSGLALCFFSAIDGCENFIGPFGESVVHKPNERQVRLRPDALFAKANIGSYDAIMAERDALLKDGRPDALETYRSLRRKTPVEYAECWMGQSGEIGFNTEKLDKRISDLRFHPQTIKGNFEWVNGMVDQVVMFIADEENGRFEVSDLSYFENGANKYFTQTEWDPLDEEHKTVRYPRFPNRLMAGGDPYKFSMERDIKKTGRGMSDGGFSVFWNHDPLIDKSTDMHEWESYRFVCTYRCRPKSDDDYAEDCLKACFWFGTTIFPETNHDLIFKHFVKRGYRGYLKYPIDPVTGKSKDKPGVHNLEGSKDKLFSLLRNYIEFRCHKEKHLRLLLELRQIASKAEMTKYDLLTAAGLALMGIENQEFKQIETFDQTVDLMSILSYLSG